MPLNKTLKEMSEQLDYLAASEMVNNLGRLVDRAILHTIWVDIAWLLVLVCLLVCFVCERDCRLFWKVWKRMGFRCFMLCDNPWNWCWLPFRVYLAGLFYWDDREERIPLRLPDQL